MTAAPERARAARCAADDAKRARRVPAILFLPARDDAAGAYRCRGSGEARGAPPGRRPRGLCASGILSFSSCLRQAGLPAPDARFSAPDGLPASGSSRPGRFFRLRGGPLLSGRARRRQPMRGRFPSSVRCSGDVRSPPLSLAMLSALSTTRDCGVRRRRRRQHPQTRAPGAAVKICGRSQAARMRSPAFGLP
jgi:hypothetical protein